MPDEQKLNVHEKKSMPDEKKPIPDEHKMNRKKTLMKKNPNA